MENEELEKKDCLYNLMILSISLLLRKILLAGKSLALSLTSKNSTLVQVDATNLLYVNYKNVRLVSIPHKGVWI